MTDALVPAVLVGLAVLAWPSHRDAQVFVVAGHGSDRLRRRAPARWSRRSSEPELTVPDVLDLLALALQAGASTMGALRTTADRLPGLTGQELRSVAAALEWGLPDETAWGAAPARWEPAGRALRLAARAGVPPADLLRRAAEDARRERLDRVETATARLGVRLVLPLGLAFLPGFVLTTVVPVVLALAGSLISSGQPLQP
ncbi:type II secretion system F family protein [Ornithinimicrobium murale]|uniref:type II secretion system F family protein n=1 Tax=Ornithinimicrobium murale TaxID=1050153 RepID=UPI000E0CEFC1|nr:type II secretion system F family protein [Ornithinimicrobium murale]